jgi:citrate lyase beta subunit
MTEGISERLSARADLRLGADDERHRRLYPGHSAVRQPVHTVYVPADQTTPDLIGDWGREALDALDRHGPLPTPELVEVVDLVRVKLAKEPIEDLRIDLEDGYGIRADATEDRDVVAAAELLATVMRSGGLAYGGVRIKSFDPAVRSRAIRSLSVLIAILADTGPIPSGLRITLPKVTSIAQVEVLVELLAALEKEHRLDSGALRFEIQVETPQAVLGADGAVALARMIHVAPARCVGLHYGTYDYSAALGVSAAHQSLEHPVADFAKSLMQVAVAGTGVVLSDGATNVLPVGDSESVRSAWSLHARLVRRSLDWGIYRGWDLHPAQLPTRFAATYAFYREGLPSAAARLRGYLDRRSGGVAEEPATAQALSGFLSRCVGSGAVKEAELVELCGITAAEVVALAGAPSTGAQPGGRSR